MSTSSFLKKIFLSSTFLLVSSLHSATLSDPIKVENPASFSFSTTIFPCYNFSDNNYLLTWSVSDGSYNYVFASIYDTQGNVVIPAYNPFPQENFLPNSCVTSCYNSQSNQYLITWYDFNNTGIIYAFLDAQANLIQDPLTLSGYTTSGNIYCCFNPFTKQYFLTWAAYTTTIYYPVYYAIINSDGTVFKEPTLINCPTSEAGNGGTVNCCFNSSTQQYLVSWISTTLQRPFFTILNADGSVYKNDMGIEGQGYRSVTTCYNSLKKTYFLSWFDISHNTYFCILDSKGNVETPATKLENISFSIDADLYCSYNPTINNFLITGITNSENLQSQFCVISSQGETVYPQTVLSNPEGFQSVRTPFSSFGFKDDTFMITRIASTAPFGPIDGAYLQFFTQVPPRLQNSRTIKKTFFPSFTPTNPGKKLF